MLLPLLLPSLSELIRGNALVLTWKGTPASAGQDLSRAQLGDRDVVWPTLPHHPAPTPQLVSML